MQDLLDAAASATGPTRLELLIGAWRQTRHPELATLIAAHARSLEPTLGFDPNDLDAWHALAPQASARQRGELLERIETTKWPLGLAQLEQLATWPADPRTVDTLLELVRRAPYRSHPARPLWRKVYALLIELADPRSAAALSEAPADYARAFPRAETKTWIERHYGTLVEQLEALPRPEAPTAAQLEQIAALTPASSALSEEELLAQIYADPSNDDPRAVYADLLSSRGDARGELITLQLTPKLGKPQRARIKTLLRDHQMQWLGEAADIMLATDLAFARGFPTAGALDGGASEAGIRRLTGAREWRSFTRLDVRGDRPGYHEFLSHEVFHGLEQLTTVSPSALRGFVEAAPRALKTLVTSGDLDELPEPVFAQLIEGRGMPALETLGMIHWTRTTPLGTGLPRVLASPLGSRLRRFELYQSSEYVGGLEEWLAALVAHEHCPDNLLVSSRKGYRHGAGFHYELTRSEGSWNMRATYKARPKKADNFALLAQLLPRLAGVPIAKLVVKTPRYTLADAPRGALERAVEQAGIPSFELA